MWSLTVEVFHVCYGAIHALLPQAQPNQKDPDQYSEQPSAIQKLSCDFSEDAHVADASLHYFLCLFLHARFLF